MEVLNKHTASNEDLQNSVYIGRGSPLGNPYPVGKEHGTNEDVVQKYRKYLAQKLISRDPKIENAIRSLSPDSRLVCFCKPKPCHGDVVKEFYYELHNGTDYDHVLRSFKEKHNLDRLDYYPEDDGVTHINVWSKAKTPLGRSLSNFAHTPFDHPIHGHFSSVEGFWYWLSTGGTRNFETIRHALVDFSRNVKDAPDLTKAVVELSQPTLFQKIISVSEKFKLKTSSHFCIS